MWTIVVRSRIRIPIHFGTAAPAVFKLRLARDICARKKAQHECEDWHVNLCQSAEVRGASIRVKPRNDADGLTFGYKLWWTSFVLQTHYTREKKVFIALNRNVVAIVEWEDWSSRTIPRTHMDFLRPPPGGYGGAEPKKAPPFFTHFSLRYGIIALFVRTGVQKPIGGYFFTFSRTLGNFLESSKLWRLLRFLYARAYKTRNKFRFIRFLTLFVLTTAIFAKVGIYCAFCTPGRTKTDRGGIFFTF